MTNGVAHCTQLFLTQQVIWSAQPKPYQGLGQGFVTWSPPGWAASLASAARNALQPQRHCTIAFRKQLYSPLQLRSPGPHAPSARAAPPPLCGGGALLAACSAGGARALGAACPVSRRQPAHTTGSARSGSAQNNGGLLHVQCQQVRNRQALQQHCWQSYRDKRPGRAPSHLPLQPASP